jgi:hypothetical protein
MSGGKEKGLKLKPSKGNENNETEKSTEKNQKERR